MSQGPKLSPSPSFWERDLSKELLSQTSRFGGGFCGLEGNKNGPDKNMQLAHTSTIPYPYKRPHN